MIGEEPDLDIKGVLLIRGHDIKVQELIDHPQMEYMQARKMNHEDAADRTLIKEYFNAKTETSTCEGKKVQISMWHK